MYQILFLLLTAVSGSLSQLLINGGCPITSGSTASNNYESIIGTWYQMERITNSEESGDCATTFFGGVTVTANTMINREVVNGSEVYKNGTITLRPLEPHRFTVTFSNEPLAPREYYLIGANFTNYALIGRCDEYVLNNATQTNLFAWKFSRSNTLAAADNTAINQLLAGVPALASATWRTTSHDSSACQLASGAGSVASSLVLIVTALLFAAKDISRD